MVKRPTSWTRWGQEPPQVPPWLGLDSWTPEWAVTLASGDPALGRRVVVWASVSPSVSLPIPLGMAWVLQQPHFFCVAVGKAMSSLGLGAISKPDPSWFLTK